MITASPHLSRSARHTSNVLRAQRGVTLVEAMMSLLLFGMCLLAYLGTLLQSRRTSETSILHSASTNIVYGIIEQIKELDYYTQMPSSAVDPGDSNNTAAPNVRVVINQNLIRWLKVKYTKYSDTPNTPKAPLTTPGPDLPAASVGTGGAIDNLISDIELSSASGASSQKISLNIWIWVDEIPDTAKGVSEAKRVTVVYTYKVNVGSGIRTIRNREVFLRTLYDR